MCLSEKAKMTKGENFVSKAVKITVTVRELKLRKPRKLARLNVWLEEVCLYGHVQSIITDTLD